ncbi:MAG TPA: 23S rRNA (adenine(2503)-C(2))-methyltransferase RlmN [Chitinophagaceae bacterium]|nr:23S rRNA (adenine(2503)-C(2))-methyltransferase RlmN [Chitinophagaceae bacterium]
MKNLRQVSVEEIVQVLIDLEEPKYRAEQIHDWIWKKHVSDIDQMTNLSIDLREKLKQNFFIPKVDVHHSQVSDDGTIKSRFVLHDGFYTEGVLIPTDTRMTACVSSQVGCSLSCKFCATGYLKRSRNLDYDEIVDEVTLINEQAINTYGQKLTNIVYMGMGEPLLNYQNTIKSIERITAPDGLNMSPRRITVSTAGVAKMIKKLGDDEVRFNLAISLHAPTDEQRNQIMPINETNNLESLIEAVNYFYKKTKTLITFEYILFDKFNDSLEDAEKLVQICRRLPVRFVNLIEYNSIDMATFSKPDEKVIDKFQAYLESNGITARLRRSRGKDIDAACGQLANIDQES